MAITHRNGAWPLLLSWTIVQVKQNSGWKRRRSLRKKFRRKGQAAWSVHRVLARQRRNAAKQKTRNFCLGHRSNFCPHTLIAERSKSHWRLHGDNTYSNHQRQPVFDSWYAHRLCSLLNTTAHHSKPSRLTSDRQITDTMGEAVIEGSAWRLVEVGRVVLINGDHPFAGGLATIVEIIDHKRVR